MPARRNIGIGGRLFLRIKENETGVAFIGRQVAMMLAAPKAQSRIIDGLQSRKIIWPDALHAKRRRSGAQRKFCARAGKLEQRDAGEKTLTHIETDRGSVEGKGDERF